MSDTFQNKTLGDAFTGFGYMPFSIPTSQALRLTGIIGGMFFSGFRLFDLILKNQTLVSFAL
jgi:hypothetical protein